MSVYWGGKEEWDDGALTVPAVREWKPNGLPTQEQRATARTVVRLVKEQPAPIGGCGCRSCRSHRAGVNLIRRVVDGLDQMGEYALSDAPAVKAAMWSFLVGAALYIAGLWVYAVEVWR